MPGNSAWTALGRLLGFNGRDAAGNNGSRHNWLEEEERALLPRYRNGGIQSAIPAEEVTKVCLRLRHLVQECVPCEMEESRITSPHSRIITNKVILAARESAGPEYRGCVVYALLVNQRWFRHEALVQLWDADLHKLRAETCGVIAKAIIEEEEDVEYLLHAVLLRRYSFVLNGTPTPPVNVIEKAVDLHAIRVIASSGYQKCISYLWKGWLVQDENDASVFVDYKDKGNTNFFAHVDPDRMRAPKYQNAAQMLFSIIYLALYTAVINSVNPSGELDGAEIALYIFTLGYVCDELVKFYKAGYHILGFWNAFNGVLYSFLTVSLIFRIIGQTYPHDEGHRNHYSTLSYNLLAFVAPLFWSRLLLYLDSFRFFGAMLVVLKVMMKESVIFFALLVIIIIGFLQAFIGLDLTDDDFLGDVLFIVESMLKAIMQSPEFEGFESFGPPFGIILYYCFTFVVMIILLNILIALYNSAYEDIYENADDEYLALFSQKTMQFVRAPDENVYIAPLNLVEIVVSIIFEWWLPKERYEFINDCVMGFIYSPLLLVAAFFETRAARTISFNRSRGEEDDDVVEEWEQMERDIDFEAEGWIKTCDSVKPNMDDDAAVLEVKKLREEVEELKALLVEISKAVSVRPAIESKSQDAEDDSKKDDSKKDDAKDSVKKDEPKNDDPKKDDIKKDDSETDDSNNDASKDIVKKDDAKDVKKDDAKADAAKADDAKTDDAKADHAKTDDTKKDDAADEASKDAIKKDDAKDADEGDAKQDDSKTVEPVKVLSKKAQKKAKKGAKGKAGESSSGGAD